MKAVVLVVAVAMMASAVVAQNFCNGMNVTMNPQTIKPLVGAYTGAGLSQKCPFGYYMDTAQGKCITYRQLVNNYYLAPCYTDADCGSNIQSSYAFPSGASYGQIMKCGVKKFCTWVNTRAQNDTCDDNLNCYDYSGTDYNGNALTVLNGCDEKTKTCAPIVNVTVASGAKCGYVSGTQYFVCDAQNWCYNKTMQPAGTGYTGTGSGICMPLTAQNQLCTGKLNCAGGLYCGGLPIVQQVNYTCQPLVALGGSCYRAGQTFECSQTAGSAYCAQTATVGAYTCQTYQAAGATCTTFGANYLSTLPQQCAMGLRCLRNPTTAQFQCYQPQGYNDTMGCTTTPATDFSANNCSTGLTCVTLGGTLGNRCITGAQNDPCYASGANTDVYKDSCQWNTNNLYCNFTAGGVGPNGVGTCIPRVAAGTACGYLQQCMPGLQCYNGTVCKGYQQLGQACNNIDLDPTQYLNCAPGLLCSRGVCINNFTVSVGGLCSQDRDCDTGMCDAATRRCTQRKLCRQASDCTVDGTLGSAMGQCVCSAGTENMGQCVFDNCDKQRISLINCLNPLFYDRYFVNGSYILPTRDQLPSWYALLDSSSSFYSKCSGQHSSFVRCQGLMSKWGAPSVGLGDLLNYDLATISASSSVSVSVMVLVAFIMSAFMYL